MLRRASQTLLLRQHAATAAAAAASAPSLLLPLPLLPCSTWAANAPLHRAFAAQPAQQQQQHQPAPSSALAAPGNVASSSGSSSSSPPPEGGDASANDRKSRELLRAHTHRLDFKMATLGSVVSPYKGAPPPLGFSWPLSAEGRRAARQRLTEYFALGLAIASLMQSVPNFSFKHLKPAFAEVFTTVSRAFVEDRLDDISDLVDAAELKRMANERDAWHRQFWERVDWRLDGELSLKDMSIVQGRLCKLHRDANTAFVQLTVRIPSRQRFAAYARDRYAGLARAGGRGGSVYAAGGRAERARAQGGGAPAWELVAGDPGEVLDVVDHWVFERKIHSAPPGTPSAKFKTDPPRARWRLVRRLTLAAGGGGSGGSGSGGDSDGDDEKRAAGNKQQQQQ